jgi:hypothetical protein
MLLPSSSSLSRDYMTSYPIGKRRDDLEQRLSYGMGDRGIGVRFKVGTTDFSLFYSVQTVLGVHSAYIMSTGSVSFGGGRAAGE